MAATDNSLWLRATALALAYGALACGSETATQAPAASAADTSPADIAAAADAGDTATADPWAGAPPEKCMAGTAWDGKTALFEDITKESGLAEQDVVGIRLSGADLDGDLRPELFVRSMAGAGRREDFTSGKRLLFVLKAKSGPKGFAFDDITQSSAMLQTRDGADGRQAHVVVYGDADNDGDVDVFAGNSLPIDPAADKQPGDSSELMVNDGLGHFSLAKTQTFADPELRKSLTSASFVDYDRDGNLDLWLGYSTWGPKGADLPVADQLLRGDGKGGFSIVTAAEGLMTLPWKKQSDVEAGTVHRITWGTAACDVNGDGAPDLLGVSYGRYFNSLWLNGVFGSNGPRFGDVRDETGFGRDDDDDWTSNWNAQCYCQENPKAADCATCKAPEVNCPALKKAFGGAYRWNHATDRKAYRLGGNTGTAACADLDRDGDLDFVFGSIVHPDVGRSSDPLRIALNDGQPLPQLSHLKSETSGLKHTFPGGQADDVGDMTLAVADFDNDGRLDILVASSDYPGTKAKLFMQQDDGKYVEFTGPAGLKHPHAISPVVADFDRDGDLDVVMGHSRARCSMSPEECYPNEQVHAFRNLAANQANWLQIQLVGTGGSNRSAIGARVRVKAGGQWQMQELGGGFGHFGMHNDLVLHFGLGANCAVEAVEVRWPDAAGTTETFAFVRSNQLVRLTQGQKATAYPLYKP